MGCDLTKKRNMKKIEVNGEYWEQVDTGSWRYQNSKDFMKVNGEFYIPQNREFKSKLISYTLYDLGTEYISTQKDMLDVTESSNGFLKIGCSWLEVKDIKKLLKEYEEFQS